MNIPLKENERLDDLQNGYHIIQNTRDFCYGIDAVLLSDFARVKKGEQALDLGTGTGIIPILLKAKTQGEHFTGLEIQEQSAEMAGRSVVYNHLEDAITIRTGDIKEATAIFGRASFSVVTCNPPYMHGNHGLTNPHLPKAIARHEVLCTLEDVISQTAQLLKPRGRFYMVHRPFRLAEIMGLMMQYKLEPKRMRLVYPYVDREPNMVLIEGLLGGNSRITVEKPLIVYEKPGVYTDQYVILCKKQWSFSLFCQYLCLIFYLFSYCHLAADVFHASTEQSVSLQRSCQTISCQCPEIFHFFGGDFSLYNL